MVDFSISVYCVPGLRGALGLRCVCNKEEI